MIGKAQWTEHNYSFPAKECERFRQNNYVLLIDRLPQLVNMTVQQSGGFHDFGVGFLERGILDPSYIISFKYVELKGVWREFVYS